MPARYRVALHGFSEFERTTLTFCFRHAATRTPAYEQVDLIADADFIVADANHVGIAGSATRGSRLRDTLFVGEQPPLGAAAHIRRPLDPERILRALDTMAAQRAPRGGEGAGAPDVVLPLAPGAQFPLLDMSEAVDTTPAAFQHEPVSITFTDLDALPAADTAPGALDAAAPALPLPPPPPPRPQPRPRAAAPPRRSEDERAAAKEAARRASRAARMAQSRNAPADAPREVLLLDAAEEPGALHFLLEAFGFRVLPARSVSAALAVLESTPIVAAFLDLAVHDAERDLDSLDLCQQIKQRWLPLAGAVPAIMLVARHDIASERVRAKLAGCDAFLTRPVSRGDAARALEACNVALPADSRRSTR